MKAKPEGADQRPASSGVRSITSWIYCATNSHEPKAVKTAADVDAERCTEGAVAEEGKIDEGCGELLLRAARRRPR